MIEVDHDLCARERPDVTKHHTPDLDLGLVGMYEHPGSQLFQHPVHCNPVNLGQASLSTISDSATRHGSSFREERTYPVLELLARDLGTPGTRYPYHAFHLIVGEPRLDQFLQIRKKYVVEELAHLMGDLFVERLGGDRRLFLLFGGFLLGLELLVVFLADSQTCLGTHDGGDHSPLFRLLVIQPVEQGLGVGVRGEYVELADGHVAWWLFLRHPSLLSETSLAG